MICESHPLSRGATTKKPSAPDPSEPSVSRYGPEANSVRVEEAGLAEAEKRKQLRMAAASGQNPPALRASHRPNAPPVPPAMDAWVDACFACCPRGHDSRALLDETVKGTNKALMGRYQNDPWTIPWGSVETSFAREIVDRHDREREALETPRRGRVDANGGASGSGSGSGSVSGSGSGSGSAAHRLSPSTPSSSSSILERVGSREAVGRRVRFLIEGCPERQRENVDSFLRALNASDFLRVPTRHTRECVESILRRAPESRVSALCSSGLSEWMCRLHVLFWSHPFPGERLSPETERRCAAEETRRWFSETDDKSANEYEAVGFQNHDGWAFDLSGVPRFDRAREIESLRDACSLGLPRRLLETSIAREAGDVLRGVALALERAGK